MNPLSPRPALGVFLLLGTLTACGPAKAPQERSSSSTLTAADMERYAGEPIERVLERKVPGVAVARTEDGGVALRIRGASSFDGRDASPLYVLNGLPIEPGRHGAVPGLNPYDIETIRVLKGSEAALYGIDGANGVIIITTKKAAKRQQY